MELLDTYYKDNHKARSTHSAKQYKYWLYDYLKPLSILFYSRKPSTFAKLLNQHLKTYNQFCDYMITINLSLKTVSPILKDYFIGIQQISSIIILLGMILKKQPINLNIPPRSQKEKSVMMTFLKTSNTAILKMNRSLLHHQSRYKSSIGPHPLALGSQLQMWHNHLLTTIQQRLIVIDQPIAHHSYEEPLL